METIMLSFDIEPFLRFSEESTDREHGFSPVIRAVVHVAAKHAEHALSSSEEERSQIIHGNSGLTFTHHCVLLHSESTNPSERSTRQRRKWRITRRVPRRIRQVISANSQTSCGDLLQFRTLKSRRNSTPKNGRRRGSGRPLPALLPQRIRKPFLPPCQSPPQRLTASPRSAIRLK
jgi:hypothetical protein